MLCLSLYNSFVCHTVKMVSKFSFFGFYKRFSVGWRRYVLLVKQFDYIKWVEQRHCRFLWSFRIYSLRLHYDLPKQEKNGRINQIKL